MMKKNNVSQTIIFITGLIFITFCISACTASNKLTKVWKDEGFEKGTVQKVLVIGVSENLKRRKIFEESFAQKLKAEGCEALTGISQIPVNQKTDKDSIKAKALEIGADAVFVTHLVGIEDTEIYNPPQSIMTPYSIRFGTYYSTIDQYVNDPGYYSGHKIYRLETRLYDTESEKLIWSANSETVDPESMEKVIDDLCGLIVKNLRENKLIQ